MSKISLTDLVNLDNATTAVNAINSNNAVLVAALDNTLSRDGTSPNTMGANLDMNNNQILNSGTTSYTVSTLPTPVRGLRAVVTDGASSLSWGTTVTGGGTTVYLVWYNGTNWTVTGK